MTQKIPKIAITIKKKRKELDKILMKPILMLCVFLYFPLLADANIGGNLATKGGEAASCRILTRDISGKLTRICSGTLVTTTKIITAGHCIDKAAFSTSVECGYQGIDGESKIEITPGGSQVVTEGIVFKEKRTDVTQKLEKEMRTHQAAIDIGMIELQTEITSIEPVAYTPSAVSDFFEKNNDLQQVILKKDVECKMEGYGINNEGLSGMLNSAPFFGPVSMLLGDQVIKTINSLPLSSLKSEEKISFQKCLYDYLDKSIPANFISLAKDIAKNKLIDQYATFGDSGGSLLCKKKSSRKWSLVGILHGGGMSKSSMFTEWHTFSDEDKESLIDGKSRPEDPIMNIR